MRLALIVLIIAGTSLGRLTGLISQCIVSSILTPATKEANMGSLYDAIAQAETGSFNDPWIRTTYAPPRGSSAFGPVQITGTKAKDYAARNILSKESQQFVNDTYGPLTDTFLKYGKEPDMEGYDSAYDYGGSGFFLNENREAYNKMAEEMLAYDFQKGNGDVDAFIESWRGVSNDERYNKEVKQALEILKSK